MGKKGRNAKSQSTASSRTVNSCKKFQPQTLTKRLEKRQAERKHRRQDGFTQLRSLADLVEDAESRQNAFTTIQQSKKPDIGIQIKDGVRRSFYKEFRKVVEQADVVLQVLDARDPEGCRCRDAESAVLAQRGKRLILVLNKIDLVPPDIALQWHKYLSSQFPTVLFKANTQSQKCRLKQSAVDVRGVNFKMFSSSACLGAKELMKLLVNYTRNKGIRTSIRVGVIGLPNVGKSSLINSLLRNRSCTVGAMPGVTKTVQEVELDKNIKLLDSPGVVLAKNVGPLATIQNSVKMDSLEDPTKPIELILEHCGVGQLASHYQIESFTSAHELLALLAFRFGKLLNGGLPDVESAARILLKDWNNGSVQFYTKPPTGAAIPSHASTEIVADWAAEFNIDEVMAVRVEEGSTDVTIEQPDPELSVKFKVDKAKEELVDRLFDKPYQMPHLQNAQVVKTAKKKVKRERKKMDKFSDMFDNMDIDMGSDDDMKDGT